MHFSPSSFDWLGLLRLSTSTSRPLKCKFILLVTSKENNSVTELKKEEEKKREINIAFLLFLGYAEYVEVLMHFFVGQQSSIMSH